MVTRKRLEIIKKEVLKCKSNMRHFLHNYARISHPIKGRIPFKTYKFQDELLDKFEENQLNLILKARQMGISTIVAGYIAWMVNFHSDKNVFIVATKLDTAVNVLKKVKFILDGLPDWMRIKPSGAREYYKTKNKRSIELANNSSVKAITTSSDSGRSEGASLFVIDEAAFINGLEELWMGLGPTIATGGKCIVLSTPNGASGWFYDQCMDAEAGLNNFELTTLKWDRHPDRDKKWFARETKNMSQRAIAQEYECDFNLSGNTVIEGILLDKLLSRAKRQPYDKFIGNEDLWVWKDPEPDREYIIGADVARGDGEDSSTIQVIDVDTLEQVAEYKGQIEPELFAVLLADVGEMYNNALVVPEYNTYGYQVSKILQKNNYKNLYFQKKNGEYVTNYEAEIMDNVIGGFSTTSASRPLIIANLERKINSGQFTINSRRSIVELKTFVWKNEKPQAEKGKDDDLIMASAIALWAREKVYGEIGLTEGFTNAMISGISRVQKKISTDNDFARKRIRSDQRNSSKTVKKSKSFIWRF